MRKAQLEIRELTEELRLQNLKYTDLEQRYTTLKNTYKEKLKGKGKESTLNDNDDQIGLHARRFGVMNEIFVPKNIFLQPWPQNVGSDDADRWDNDETMKVCVIAELYEEIPSSLHNLLEKTSSFRDKVQSSPISYTKSATTNYEYH